VARIITGNIIIPNKPIYRRLAVDEIEVLTKDMNKVTVLRLRVGFKYLIFTTIKNYYLIYTESWIIRLDEWLNINKYM